METDKKKTSFVMHVEMWPAIRHLKDEAIGQLFRAIMEYHYDGVIPDGMDPDVMMAFQFFKARFDLDHEKWIERCRINKENRAKGK